jgi:CRP/FNR family transcriptional regulator, cyclic AMP receptor protein
MPPPSKLQPVRSEVDSLALLRAHPMFGALELAQIKRLAAYATTRKVPRGTTLFAKGDPGASLFAIRSGSVKISAPSLDGREAVFNLLHEGEVFGEIALLDGRPRTADAIAMSDCEFMVIDRRDFLAFAHGDPKVSLKLIELLCARLRFASEHLEELVFLSLPARLARTLLRLAESNGQTAAGRKLAITQREISQIVGMTRESINKQLRTWEKRKMVKLERGGILVLAPDALAAVATASEEDERASA